MEELQPKPYPKNNQYIIYPDGRVWSNKRNRFLSQSISHGYPVVGLRIDKKTKIYFVHRLVAETFIPNPNNYPVVNHIDENRKNNNYSNLEWVTYEQNDNHGTRNARISEKLKGSNNPKAKGVQMLDSKTKETLKTFGCIADAYDYLQVSRRDSSISKVCSGKNKTAYGYGWRYCE